MPSGYADAAPAQCLGLYEPYRFDMVIGMGALDNLQGDWWWSYIEDASAGQRWIIEGDRISENGKPLAWSNTPGGIRVERPGGKFILIEPSDRGLHTAHLYVAELGLDGYDEGGTLVPYADAEREGWTKRPPS
jgi:hypothetical protein